MRVSLFAAFLGICLQGACIPALSGGADGKPAASNPGAADAITVTPLDQVAAVDAPPAAARPKPRPVAAVAPKPEVAAAEPEVPAEPVVPEKPKSPEEILCGKKGGAWVGAGKSGAKACAKSTKDGGQHCTKAGDCEGLCLARSATCAPVQPLFGCNDILQDNGLRVTLCID